MSVPRNSLATVAAMAESAPATTADDLLQALRRIDAALAGEPGNAVVALVEEVRRLTGSELVMFTLVEEIDGELHQHAVWVSASEDNAVAIAPGDHWRWDESACIQMLRDHTNYTPDFVADHPGHALATRLGIKGFLSVPVLAPAGDRVSGVLCAVDSRGVVIPDDALAVVRVLTAGAVAPLLRAWGAQDSEASLRASGDAAYDLVSDLRRTQDQVGNSLAVALGWLHVLAEDESLGPAASGARAALRRLEGAQVAVASLLRDVHAAAIGTVGRLPVDLVAEVRVAFGPAAGGLTGEVWVLANRVRLSDFLRAAGGSLMAEVVVRGEVALVPFAPGAAITTASLLALDTSGGRVADAGGRPAAAWPRTTPVARP